jgi:hypothetical protein
MVATIVRSPLDPDVERFSVSGRVTGVAGRSSGALRVRLFVSGEPTLASPVAADGSFRFDGIPAGTYEAEVVGGARRSRVIVSGNDVTGVVVAPR